MELPKAQLYDEQQIEQCFAPIIPLTQEYHDAMNNRTYNKLPAIRAQIYTTLFETPQLFDYITRNGSQVHFNTKSLNNSLILPAQEEKLYEFNDIYIPYRPDHFYTTLSSSALDILKEMFQERTQQLPSNVFVKWIETVSSNNKTHKLLHRLRKDKLHKDNQYLYVVTPQTRNGHTNLVISRLSYRHNTISFLIDARGRYTSSITYLNKRRYLPKGRPCPHPSTLVDASDDIDPLQDIFQNNDYNCAIYTLHYALAALQFFNKTTHPLLESFEHACTASYYDLAGTTLHNGLKSYLNEYFIKEDGDFLKHNYATIMYSHCITRWEAGNFHLKKLREAHYLLKLKTNNHLLVYMKASLKKPDRMYKKLPFFHDKLLIDGYDGHPTFNRSAILEKPLNKEGNQKPLRKSKAEQLVAKDNSQKQIRKSSKW